MGLSRLWSVREMSKSWYMLLIDFCRQGFVIGSEIFIYIERNITGEKCCSAIVVRQKEQ